MPVRTRDERKVVTVVFVDLVGFTSQAERLDAEDVRHTQAAYFAAVRAEIERFGGTVEKFIGDAVVACFGAPAAHEDDPERAVRAAFAVHTALERLNETARVLPLHARIGITTGEAVVTVGAAGTQAMVSGDLVTRAARLQEAAPAGGILVGLATQRATRQRFQYVDHAPLTVPGSNEPVLAWHASGVTSRAGVDIVHDGSPLVGRDSELALLTSSFQRAVRESSAQLITLVGGPGIGKSRMVWELSRFTDALPELLVWRQGRCLPYGDGVTYWALSEIVKAEAGILETDSGSVATDRLRKAVEALIGNDVDWVVERLAPLVGIVRPTDGQAALGESFAAWQRFLVSLTATRPAVLVFEDLHWADDGMLDFIDQLVDAAANAPLLVVCTTRPEMLDRRPLWGGGKRNAITLSLSPLTGAETAALFAGLLGQAVLPIEVHQTLLELAGGNPLYAEEYVRMLIDRGLLRRDGGLWGIDSAATLPLPHSVQGIISARLDALDTSEKEALLDAAVIGEVFWLSALAHLSQDSRARVEAVVGNLERRELLRAQRTSSVQGELEYAFRHVLVRDVAYAQIPRHLRAERHRRAAQWLGELAPGRMADQSELLTHHWLAAFELDPAALQQPEHRDAARRALTAAAERAYGLHALETALTFSSRALELWPADIDPVDRWRLVVLHEEVRFLNQEDDFYASDGPAMLRMSAAALLGLGELAESARAETLLGQVEWYRTDQQRAFSHLDRAAELLTREPISERKASAYAELSRLHMFAHHHNAAIEVGQEALDMATQLGLLECQANVLVTMGTSRYLAGDGDRAISELESAVELCRTHHLRALHRAANNLAVTLQEEGELRRSYALVEESEAAGAAAGLSLTAKFTEADLAVRAYWEGDWSRALGIADSFLGRMTVAAPHPWEAHLRSLRALLRALRAEPIGDDIDRALRIARPARDPQLLRPSLAHGALTKITMRDNDGAGALVDELLEDWRPEPQTASREWLPALVEAVTQLRDKRLDETLDLLRSISRQTLWVKAAIGYCEGGVALRNRQPELAGSSFAEAVASYDRIGDVSHRAVSELMAGLAFTAAGRQELAGPYLATAHSFYARNQAKWLLDLAFPRASEPTTADGGR